ncbi:HD domain-containing phosphohydrolase [uncultured Sphaerochaeta sp.]|uniref:bifunctional diguanylate cyclase/phosphohydrolase n=1 Tax=uncultured Sphaerochaeta sp. TaxID=886478 RepID=UPI002A0A738C|nr:HD domain-containing phosphohydrolase [uncultured Sphaerochaeta sp.]
MYKDNEGKVIGALIIGRDISAIKKREKERIDFENNLELNVQQKTAELIIANKELAFRNEEKDKRAAELIIANKELLFQNEEKEKRANELIIANNELLFQNEEKDKRAAELVLANKELLFQTAEKADRAAELMIADKELAFQNEEKADRAAELVIANKELAFQNEEKDKRAAELIIANKELVFQNEEISYISYHDFLTGLFNRIYFEQEKKRLEASDQLPISIIMGDINGLKLVNDGFGHSKGDELLVEISRILKSCCRKEDIISRIGGDEFGIILPQTDTSSAQLVCNRISDTCNKYALKGSSICPSISLGHATKNMRSETLDSIFMTAEENMARHKLLERKSIHSSIIASIKAIMFEKSQETEEHAERMVQLSKSIGMAMSLSEKQLNELELLSTLHDIGKMGVSAEILSKPGKLSDKEWVEIRKHPEVGFRIAQATPELVPIADFILYHHERWDGRGYPHGLRGEKIPLLSRIVSIVDAFDAMTNDRAYRLAMTKEKAIEEIKINSGTQFDPKVSRVFIENVLGQKWEQVS